MTNEIAKDKSFLALLPPHPPDPLHPSPNILPPLKQLNGKPMPRQLLVGRRAMHKAMASPTKPGHAIQQLLAMPTALQHAFMRRLGNEVVVRQRNPFAVAEFAFRGAGRGPDGRRRGDGSQVAVVDGGEEVGDVDGVRGRGEQSVGCQRVDGSGRGQGYQGRCRGV